MPVYWKQMVEGDFSKSTVGTNGHGLGAASMSVRGGAVSEWPEVNPMRLSSGPEDFHLRALPEPRRTFSARGQLPSMGAAIDCRSVVRGSARERHFKVGNNDFFHFQHCLHRAIGLVAIGVPEKSAERSRYDLPGQAEFVLEPSAIAFLAAVRG